MPETAEAALRMLIEGNQTFAQVLNRADAGLPSGRQVIAFNSQGSWDLQSRVMPRLSRLPSSQQC